MGFSVAATVPLLSTLDKPFYLRAARPAQERVILNFVESFKKPLDGVLIFSSFASNTSRGPQLDQKFKLTDGKLFTADNSMSVFLPSFPPGPLLPNPLVFGNPEQVQSTARLPIPTFAAQTVSTSSQESKLQLISLLGGGLRYGSCEVEADLI